MTYTPPKPPEGYYWEIETDTWSLTLNLKKKGKFFNKTKASKKLVEFSYPEYFVTYEANKLLEYYFGSAELESKDKYEGKYYYD